VNGANERFLSAAIKQNARQRAKFVGRAGQLFGIVGDRANDATTHVSEVSAFRG
jgi:hypothetical protein